MSIWESLKSAAQSLFANKMRSSLTMLGIVIGVSAVVIMVSLGQGFQTSLKSTFEKLGATALYVYGTTDKTVKSVRPLTIDDARALEDKTQAPSIAVVSPTVVKNVSVQYGNNSANVQGTGCYPLVTEIRSYTQDKGRFISDQDNADRTNVVVLGNQTTLDLFGDKDPIGEYVRVDGMKFQVVGTIAKLGGMTGDSYALMPLTTVQSKLVGGNNVGLIAVKAVSENKIDDAIAEITSIIRTRHYIMPGAADDFSIRDMREAMQSMQDSLAGFSFFLGAVGAISLIVGGIGIMNIMLVSVTERTREIGIRKAIGAKRRDIMLQFLIEAAALSFTGGLIGMLIGVIGSQFMTNVPVGQLVIKAEVSASIVIIALAVSIGTGLISGTYPAFRAARLDPIESLRHE